MLDAILGGIGLVNSFLSGVMNNNAISSANVANMVNTKNTNETNMAIAKMNNEYNYSMYRDNNEYNSPSSQASRFRAAGLSQAAAAQAVQGFQSSPPQAVNFSAAAPPNVQPQNFDFLKNMDVIGTMRQLVALDKEKSEATMLQNEVKIQPEKIYTEQQAREYALKSAQEQFRYMLETNPFHARALKFQVETQNIVKEQMELANDYMRQNIKLAEQKYGFLAKWNDSELNRISENIKLLQAETDNTKRDSLLKSFELELKKMGAPDSFIERLLMLTLNGKMNWSEIAGNIKDAAIAVKTAFKSPNSGSLYDKFLSLFDFSDSSESVLSGASLGSGLKNYVK